MAKTGSIGTLRVLNNQWTIVRSSQSVSNRATSRAGRTAEEKPPDGAWPSFLPQMGFEIIDGGELQLLPQRRGNLPQSLSSTQLQAEIEQNDIAFLITRQESGALHFQLPQRTPLRRTQRSKTNQVIFDVTLADRDNLSVRRGLISKTIQVTLVKLVKAVVGELLQYTAKLAVPKLCSLLEKQLWKTQTQGWLHVTKNGFVKAKDGLSAKIPRFPSGKRGLLLIHGTFSNTHSAFKNLSQTNFFEEASQLYGDNIFGFNHLTFSKSPAENVKDLLNELPENDLQFDIITHSRGGLVARELLEGSGLQHPRAKYLKAGQVIMVASPNAGTPLASPKHWVDKLSYFANVFELFPDNPFTTAAAWLAESLKWAATNILGNCPGLAAMDSAGGYLAELQRPPFAQDGTKYHALVSNFYPTQELLPRLLDMGVDQFFGGANDLVVPTAGGWETATTSADWIPGERVACFGLEGNLVSEKAVHHGSFFGNTESTSYLISCLRGENSKLAPMKIRKNPPAMNTRQSSDNIVEDGQPNEAEIHDKQVVRTQANPVIEVRATGFDQEDTLWLTVISNNRNTDVNNETTGTSAPILLAQYGSARVSVPFYTTDSHDSAGKRWSSLIKMQKELVNYTNGKEFKHEEQNFPNEDYLIKFGKELFKTLFPSEVRSLYNIARFRHRNRRLKIIFSSMIPWVADFPWELAYDEAAECFLACGDVRFLRQVITPTPGNKIKNKKTVLRILVVSAQPLNAGRLSIADEVRSIEESFRLLKERKLVEVEVLAGASPESLHQHLREQEDGDYFDVLHFIGHGEYDDKTNTGYLIFQSTTGKGIQLSAANFVEMVRGRGIRIVVLNACETGRGREANYNRGVAMTLVHDGIPAVLANQYSVLDRSATLFSLHFYECLASGLSVADAARESRIALRYSGVEPLDWAVPVLFSSNPDAKLCYKLTRHKSQSNSAVNDQRLFSLNGEMRRTMTKPGQLIIAVWDAENSLSYRERLKDTLDEFNALQDAFVFQLEHFSAPRGLWQVDNASKEDDGVAYLSSERVCERMAIIRKKIGADHLFCVTELPLRSENTPAIYLNLSTVNSITIFSTWNLEPPLEGTRLKKAIANQLAISLLDHLIKLTGGDRDDDPLHPIYTPGFYNDDRKVAHIAGQMKMGKTASQEIKLALKKNKITKSQVVGIQSLIDFKS